ncbi:hypothetical protein HDU88_002894 [Geranomyces variabilis]|nr:hypothetical protein HDU88_002894 [Geranomyces variabilis]
MLPKLRDLTEPEREEMDSQVQRALGGLFSRTEVLAQAAEQPAVVVSENSWWADDGVVWGSGDEETGEDACGASSVGGVVVEETVDGYVERSETYAGEVVEAEVTEGGNVTGLVKRPASSNSPLKSTTTTAAAAGADQQGAYPLHSRASSELLNQQHAADAGLKEEDEEEDVAARLTNRERMMLETANAEILESLEGSLDQVRRTTNALQEISSLHGRLAYEIQTQATAIDALYEEAWKTTDTVHRGNKQLVSAQRRFGTARLWVLIFLVVASAVLLFLDYYAQ